MKIGDKKYLVRAEIELYADNKEQVENRIEEELRGIASLVLVDRITELETE